ncbi:MAG: cupin domain-containing protein, partial [Pseudomonadota bacterium]
GSPAEHRTLVDHDMALPNSEPAAPRSFSGQRFVRHIAADAVWEASNYRGLLRQRTGVDAASGGIGDVSVLRPDGSSTRVEIGSDRAFAFRFLLEGSLTLNVAGESEGLKSGAAFVMPAGVPHSIHALSRDCRILEVAGH